MSESLVQFGDESQNMVSSDALDDSGYIVKLTGAKTVAKCGAADIPFGIANKSTKHPITGTAEANKPVGVYSQGVHYVKLSATNVVIVVNDRLKSIAGGLADKATFTAWPATYAAATAETIEKEKAMVIGQALEAKAANAGGKIRVLVTIRRTRD